MGKAVTFFLSRIAREQEKNLIEKGKKVTTSKNYIKLLIGTLQKKIL
jgi:hypothetical protein